LVTASVLESVTESASVLVTDSVLATVLLSESESLSDSD
jgi:hypothetical protein